MGKGAKEVLRAVLIDDEISFINTMQILVDDEPQINIVASARSVAEGVEAIKKWGPDLIFLDVEMEDGNGFDLLEQIAAPDLMVIFVTAFEHYAVNAFRHKAIDYLLKPVMSGELSEAIQRAFDKKQQILKANIESVLPLEKESTLGKRKKIILREMETHHVIEIDQILCCSAEGSYTKFYLENDRQVMVSKHLKEYDDILQPYGFFRTHRSHLVNLDKIIRFEKTGNGFVYLQKDLKVPVSFRKKDQLSQVLLGL